MKQSVIDLLHSCNRYKYQLCLLLVVFIAYIPLTCFQNTLLNDDIDVALSTKYFAGECFQNGSLPLWNPYQIWGFPAHADLQYTNWNLETLLTGILFGYNYIILHLLFILYLFLAALGAFLLFRHLSKDARTGFYVACVYVLSGLFTAHVQSLVTILGLVWLPYVLWSFLRWLQEPGLKHSILLCLFSYLLMTLGYQAFVFMLIPLFVILFIQQVFVYYQEKKTAAIRQLFITGILSVIVLVVLLLPVIVTQFQAKPFVGRLNGMSVEEVMMNPFSLLSALSFLNPVLTIGHDDWFKTELTMRNAFIGLIPLLLLVISLFKRRKSAVGIILLSLAALYLLGSLGDVIPVRKLMYHVLPGFKLFRFPSLMRVVAMLLLLSYLAINFRYCLAWLQEQAKKRNTVLVTLLLLNLAVTAVCFLKIKHLGSVRNGYQGIHERVVHADPWEIAFYVSFVQCVLIALLWFLWKRSNSENGFFRKLAAVTIAELMLVIWFYGQFTAFGTPKPNELQANFATMQRGFPFPSQDALNDTKYKFSHLKHFWKNTGAFKKQLFNDDAWTSFYFSNYDKLSSHLTDLKDSLQSYPLVYFSKALTEERIAKIPVDTSGRLIRNSFHVRNAEANYQYTVFSPQKMEMTVKATAPVVLNLQQCWYSGWTVKVDGLEQAILWNAGLLMSVAVPQGLHSISFEYNNPLFEKALAVSYTMLVLLIVAYMILSALPRKRKQVLLLFFLACVLGICAIFFRRSPKQVEVKNGFTYDFATSTRYYDFNTKSEIASCIKSLRRSQARNIRYSWTNYYNSPELLYALGIDPSGIPQEQASINNQITYQWKAKAMQVNHTLFDSTYSDQAFIDTVGVNQYSLMLNDTQNPYSKLITLNAAAIEGRDLYGFVTLKAKRFSNPLIVCKTKHADGSEEQSYFALNTYLLNNNDWEQVPYYFKTQDQKTGDIISLFLMNASPNAVYIKELKVECFGAKGK
jgi:hypothetical protein